MNHVPDPRPLFLLLVRDTTILVTNTKSGTKPDFSVSPSPYSGTYGSFSNISGFIPIAKRKLELLCF